MKDVVIRWIQPADVPRLVALCHAHATYEHAVYDEKGKTTRLHDDLFCDHPLLKCIVAVVNKRVVGFATFMEQYATWDACTYVYIDCLYLEEEFRGGGIGPQLMDWIVQETDRLGCPLIQWQTPTFNKRAIQFYKRLGAVPKTKERFFLYVGNLILPVASSDQIDSG